MTQDNALQYKFDQIPRMIELEDEGDCELLRLSEIRREVTVKSPEYLQSMLDLQFEKIISSEVKVDVEKVKSRDVEEIKGAITNAKQKQKSDDKLEQKVENMKEENRKHRAAIAKKLEALGTLFDDSDDN
ncbi:hypothetical protein Ddc_03302 [Ditylenchus destructor]|nr:hypothetical protein Ddc_03302 [Ditylenchus destructor]